MKIHPISIKIILVGFSVVFAACSSSGPSLESGTVPGSSPGIQSLTGARGSSGEEGLKKAGYEHRNTAKIDNSSIAHWRGKDGGCIEVTTTDGRFARIANVETRKCEDDGSAVPPSGSANAMRTVCGVHVGGKWTRYICEIEENRQGTSKLTMPDTVLLLTWKPEKNVLVAQEGVKPVEAKYFESGGETDIFVDERTFFYISNPDAAAMEVKHFPQQ